MNDGTMKMMITGMMKADRLIRGHTEPNPFKSLMFLSHFGCHVISVLTALSFSWTFNMTSLAPRGSVTRPGAA
jgi:hypothetical protein